jgi:hypothetical protein
MTRKTGSDARLKCALEGPTSMRLERRLTAVHPRATSRPPAVVLERLRFLRSVSWEWRDPEALGEGRYAGVLAQEVQAVFPELVHVHPEEGYLTVDYAGLLAYVLEAVKELDVRLLRLEEDARR